MTIMKLIDKERVVAEIEKRIQELHPTNTHKMQVGEMDRDVLMWLNALTWVKKVIDILEVKEVDLDFEQELYKAFGQVKDFTLGMRIAKHFYELGIKTKKGE